MLKTVANRLATFLMETAVLYFLSGCLALLGVYSMMKSPLLSGGLLSRYFEADIILLIYIVMLAVFCLLVLRRLALPVDGLVLAGLALLLALDPAFFNDVFYTTSLRAGLLVGALSFVLGMGVYAALIRFAGIPWMKSAAAMIALTSFFVSFYPVGLNLGWAAEGRAWYLYGLWWAPLVIVMLCLPRRRETEIRGAAVFPEPMKQWFVRSCVTIVFYILFSHLIEAGYAYGMPFRAFYLTPGFLALGLLVYRRARAFDVDVRQLVWLFGLAASFCAVVKSGTLLLHLPGGLVVSSFRCGLVAVALFFLYFWKYSGDKRYADRSWAFASLLLFLMVVSGNSWPEALAGIMSLHFAPFFFLSMGLALLTAFTDTSATPVLAGWSLLVAVVPRLPVSAEDHIGVLCQLGVIWFALVQWRYHGLARQWAYSVAGAIAFAISLLLSVATHKPVWIADYLLLTVCLFFAARALKDAFLWTLSVLGMLAIPLYLARTPLAVLMADLRRTFGFGTMMTMLAFLMLPLGYFMSMLKKRRQICR